MFNKVLVANRGAVAARVLRALRSLGIQSVAVYSEADASLRYLAEADETYFIGGPEPKASYLNQEVLLQVLSRSGADGVHPGYGFLSESAEFAQRVNATGARFIGPSPQWIEAMGHKTRARDLMSRHGLPMAPSSGLLDGRTDAALEAARLLGYPVLVKPAAGGGGIGMIGARDEPELIKAIEKARSLAERSFGSTELYLENLMLKPRHIEFQVLADRYGNIRHLYERDCSVQRRYQKVIEESPAPLLSRITVEKAAGDIVKVLGKLPYDVIGTVETLYEKGTDFRFLEMNTRLQVEHAVTEEITGVDLVVAQIRLAAGERLDSVLPTVIPNNGHAIEARIYAEDPIRFYPSPGILKTFRLAPGVEVRTETGYSEGDEITSYYDPLIVKVIAHGHNRDNAIDRMLAALDATVIEGIKHNIPFLQRILRSEQFRSGHVHTGLGMEVTGLASKGTK
jgi:acetyl-CoA carboxylase biotin carboxylase subunit